MVCVVELAKLPTLTLDSLDPCNMPNFNVLSDDLNDPSCDEPIIAHDTTDKSELVPDEVKLTSPPFGSACADCDEPIE